MVDVNFVFDERIHVKVSRIAFHVASFFDIDELDKIMSSFKIWKEGGEGGGTEGGTEGGAEGGTEGGAEGGGRVWKRNEWARRECLLGFAFTQINDDVSLHLFQYRLIMWLSVACNTTNNTHIALTMAKRAIKAIDDRPGCLELWEAAKQKSDEMLFVGRGEEGDEGPLDRLDKLPSVDPLVVHNPFQRENVLAENYRIYDLRFVKREEDLHKIRRVFISFVDLVSSGVQPVDAINVMLRKRYSEGWARVCNGVELVGDELSADVVMGLNTKKNIMVKRKVEVVLNYIDMCENRREASIVVNELSRLALKAGLLWVIRKLIAMGWKLDLMRGLRDWFVNGGDKKFGYEVAVYSGNVLSLDCWVWMRDDKIDIDVVNIRLAVEYMLKFDNGALRELLFMLFNKEMWHVVDVFIGKLIDGYFTDRAKWIVSLGLDLTESHVGMLSHMGMVVFNKLIAMGYRPVFRGHHLAEWLKTGSKYWSNFDIDETCIKDACRTLSEAKILAAFRGTKYEYLSYLTIVGDIDISRDRFRLCMMGCKDLLPVVDGLMKWKTNEHRDTIIKRLEFLVRDHGRLWKRVEMYALKESAKHNNVGFLDFFSNRFVRLKNYCIDVCVRGDGKEMKKLILSGKMFFVSSGIDRICLEAREDIIRGLWKIGLLHPARCHLKMLRDRGIILDPK